MDLAPKAVQRAAPRNNTASRKTGPILKRFCPMQAKAPSAGLFYLCFKRPTSAPGVANLNDSQGVLCLPNTPPEHAARAQLSNRLSGTGWPGRYAAVNRPETCHHYQPSLTTPFTKPRFADFLIFQARSITCRSSGVSHLQTPISVAASCPLPYKIPNAPQKSARVIDYFCRTTLRFGKSGAFLSKAKLKNGQQEVSCPYSSLSFCRSSAPCFQG